MNYNKRIERLEHQAPDNTLADWEIFIRIGGNEPGSYARNNKTGEISQDGILLERLRKEGADNEIEIRLHIGAMTEAGHEE